jgi:tetratricopeptide (TPR) repeat protein
LTYNRAGDTAKAMADYTAVIGMKDAPAEEKAKAKRAVAEPWYEKAEAAHEQKDYQEALKLYSKVIELDENQADAYSMRGAVHYALQKYDEAARDARLGCAKGSCAFAAWLRREGKMSDDVAVRANAFYDQAEKAFEQKKFTEAIALYTKAVETDKSHGNAFFRRGAAHRNIDQHEQAVDDLLSAIELNPNAANAYYLRGDSFSQLKRYRQAIRMFGYYIEQKPNEAGGYNARGWTYFLDGQHQRAIDDASQAIKLNPKAIYYDTRGQAYYALGKLADASRDALKACELGECELRDQMKKDGKLTQ